MSETKKKDGRGGKRPGAGRKPGLQVREALSVRQIQDFQIAAEAKCRETGRSLQDIVLEIAYDAETPRRDKLAAAKLYWDKSMISASEGGDADKTLGPAIYLPEQRDNVVALVQSLEK
jgi:hypothetical protein